MRKSAFFYYLIATIAAMAFGATNGLAEKNTKIVHDTEYYILEAQNGEQWAKDDKVVDEKLAGRRDGGQNYDIRRVAFARY